MSHLKKTFRAHRSHLASMLKRALGWVCAVSLMFGYPQTASSKPTSKPQSNAHSKPTSQQLNRSPLSEYEAMGRGGMVVSDNRDASEAGAQVLREGGDAIDAAVTTALMLGVLQPFASGIGGGGFAVVYRAQTAQSLPNTAQGQTAPPQAQSPKNRPPQSYALDFREVAPLGATPNMYLDKEGTPVPNLSTVGALAAGVPGEIAGLYELHQRHGRLPWARVVEPALKAARDGFPMHPLLHQRAQGYLSRVQRSTALSEALLKEGEVKAVGERVKFEALGRTLEIISREGARGFYQGPVAAELSRATLAAGGLITERDLKEYRPKERAVIRAEYQGYRLISMPPPSSGGVVILQTLRSLERSLAPRKPQDLGRYSPLYLHTLTESLKHAFADRAHYMGDPDFVDVPVKSLLSDQRIAEIAQAFNRDKTHPRESYGGAYQATPDGGTSHFNVLDQAGNAIALTTTINTGFGSRFVAGETGILLNNEMDDFIVKPGVPNAYGLIGRAANAAEAGKRPLSSMSPTIILKDGRVRGMVGGSGGPTIITGTLQVLLNLIHFDGARGEVGAAVNAWRLHHQWVPEILFHDPELPTTSLNGLLARGHKIKSWGERFNAIQALWVWGEGSTQLLIGASDPSKQGRPAVVNRYLPSKPE